MIQTIKIEVPKGKKAIVNGDKIEFVDILNYLPKTWLEFCKRVPINAHEAFINGASSSILTIETTRDERRKREIKYDRNLLPSKKAAEQHLILMQLHQLRDCYRHGWGPDWRSKSEAKYCIEHTVNFTNGNQYRVVYSETAPMFLAFQSEIIAKEFLHNFIDLIIQAGDLI